MDATISAVEAAMMPELLRYLQKIEVDARYYKAEVFSLRHAEVVHTIGLKCSLKKPPYVDQCLSIFVTIIGLSGIHCNGFVGWDDPNKIQRRYIPQVFELITRDLTLNSPSQLQRYEGSLPILFKAFERELLRDRPPSRFERLWNRVRYG